MTLTYEENVALREEFEDIISNVNFHKIKLAMQATDWTWASSPSGIPTVSEMEDEVFRLFESALDSIEREGKGYCACGGFVVEIDEEHLIKIQFVLEEQSNLF